MLEEAQPTWQQREVGNRIGMLWYFWLFRICVTVSAVMLFNVGLSSPPENGCQREEVRIMWPLRKFLLTRHVLVESSLTFP